VKAWTSQPAGGCTVRLNKEPIIEYLNSNITLMKWMIANGYQHRETLENRIKAMEAWLAKPELLAPDADASYAAVIEIDLADIKEPILACPNDPDDVKPLGEVAGTKIDEVFIGSCMTNIGHFRAAGKLLDGKTDLNTRLWIAPPTKMDEYVLRQEGYYGILGRTGARMEMPGCSLCMGNQAQIRKGSTAVSTSTSTNRTIMPAGRSRRRIGSKETTSARSTLRISRSHAWPSAPDARQSWL
jgi:aconitate hydratase 2/2-methylisocitrate dehydratase